MENKVNTIEQLESKLPSLFKVGEYLKKFDEYSGQFRSRLTIYDAVIQLHPDLDMSKFLVSPGVYAKNTRRDTIDGGWSDVGTIKELTVQYHKLLIEDVERLFDFTLNYKGLSKSFNKIESMITNDLGKIESSRRVLKAACNRANDGYDRHLIMEYYFKGHLKNLWHCSDDVHYINGVGSLMTAIRTVRHSELKKYINSI